MTGTDGAVCRKLSTSAGRSDKSAALSLSRKAAKTGPGACVGISRVLRTIRAIVPDQKLRLAGLDDEEVRLLLESMAGQLPRQVTDLVARIAHGSPFMASASLRGLVETRALVARAEAHLASLALAVKAGGRPEEMLAHSTDLQTRNDS